jgi:phenylacetate-CoA ligase
MKASPYDHLPIALQETAVTWAGWRRARTRYTRRFHRSLTEWEKTVHGPVDALQALQRRRLDSLVSRARKHVPYYQDLPAPSKNPDPLRAMAETLAGIAPLEKRTYRERSLDFLARNVSKTRLHLVRTSGTTGTPLQVWHAPETIAEEYATVWRHRRSTGVDLDGSRLAFGGQMVVPFHQQAPPFWRTNYYGQETFFSLYHMSPENLPRYVDHILEAPATYVQGYPSALHLVADAILAAGKSLPPGKINAVFTSSESLLAFQREDIEKAFSAPVRDRYGVSEFAVSMTSCHQNRLHVDMEFCIVEVEPHEETDEWVRGPLLVTGLAGYATPFMRYRIGDVGTRLKVPCPCGRPGDVFLDIDGRLEDYVATPDGRLVGRLDHIFKEQVDVAEAQIVQERAESIEVRVVPRASWGPASRRSLLRDIRARLGDDIQVELNLVRTIPREPNGKFRAVKSQVARAVR